MTADERAVASEILSWLDDPDHDDESESRAKERKVFGEWLEQDRILSDAQRRWLFGTHERLCGGIHYENAYSAGRVPEGKHLATPVPEVLLRPLPKKPPGRRT